VISATYLPLILRNVRSEKKDIGKLVAVAPRTASNVYILNIVEGENFCLSQVDEIWLWHRRLGNLIFHNLIKANEKEVVRDLVD
jgi:hypothetical protein